VQSIEIKDKRVTQSDSEAMAAPMELDLIAFFRVLQDDLLERIENQEGRDLEEFIESLGRL
jgi:hypothetical protein